MNASGETTKRSIRNQGAEVTLNQRLVDRTDYSFEVQLTGSTNKNRILTLGEGVTPVFSGNRNTQYNAPGYFQFRSALASRKPCASRE